ncbi:CENPE protein, partial [Centropus unirufus]|nr:CENPE protein [Centropus unirufus]
EKALEEKESLYWKSENNTISEVNGTKVFSYDRVFHSSDNTQQLYEGVAVPIIQSAVQGYNGTIFAYGQTASGKTYTMMGNEDSEGIIPRAVQHVFKIICEIPDREFLLRVSYMEIYNEAITDLLCDTRKKKPLAIREDINRNIYVEDLIEEVVVAPEQVMEWIRKGEKNRQYGETKMNEHSSRSHTIFRMIIESRERSDPVNANCDGAVMVSHLNLVDLAGSERASQTGSEGVRLKEGCNINRSLFILGQVIKKLCDDPSGFINYRDSKLTRILQNSLGGNAKTLIICTITPVSFDVTLGTLQFANTAKRMKNTPKVNEVLDDDALLKRYRKEILDLKKQLEEVSSKTQIHAMEKDQLAQLLEEKNSLQKVQEDKIRNLTEMLVTSASFSSKRNPKAKRRRRVTWAPGKINQVNASCFEDFENPRLSDPKKMKLSLTLPEADESLLENSVHDNQCLTLPAQMSEIEWTDGPNMDWTRKDFEESVQLCEALALEKDIAVNEINVLRANFDNLVLENEQLKREINEIKEKLKEKIEIDEFEALEKQTQKEHEVQLMHEITKLKSLVSNAEVYNEELEEEINSKLEQLKEKENKIQVLQNHVEELQKAEAERKDVSILVGDSDKLIKEIEQLNKSLLDSENIALDAKKESAFLRTENLELKEKMNELLDNYQQMQKDVEVYKSQIEEGKARYKKMQGDLQKELQSVFQENMRLTSMMDGKVPKDLLSPVELERKTADLKEELEKALLESALLQKRVNELAELESLPHTVEIQQKEILEKCEELQLLKLEREKLLSEAADNEARLKCMAEEIGKSKDDLADVQLQYATSHQEYVALKQLHEELAQKYVAASESNEQMKLQIDILSKETRESATALDEVKLELSRKMKELEEKTAEYNQLLEVREDFSETQQKLNEMGQLEEQEKVMEAKDSEIQAVLQQLMECQEEIKTLTEERDYLKQKEEFLQAETDQLKEDIKDTVSMNILAHEELRNTQSSLKQSQDAVKKLEKSISEKESQILSVEKTLGKTIEELEIKISEMTKEVKTITSERDQLAEEKSEKDCSESDQLQALKEQISLLTKENNSLQDKLGTLHLKKDNCGEGILIPQIPEKSIEQELLLLREELSQAQRKLCEMEELKANECQRGSEKMERTDFISKLCDCQDLRTLTEKGEDYLKMQLQNLQNEEDQLKETIQETTSENSEMLEELRHAHTLPGQYQETTVELKGSISEEDSQVLKVQEALKETIDELQEKLAEATENLTRVSSEHSKLLAEKEQMERMRNESVSEQLEKITLLNQEKDELQQMVEACKAERDQLEAECRKSKEKSSKVLSEMENLQEELEHQKEQADIQKNVLARGEEKVQNAEGKTKQINKWKENTRVMKLNEDLNLVMEERQKLLELKEKTENERSELQQLEKRCDLLAQERDQFQEIIEDLQAEKNKLEIKLQESVNKILETEKQLEWQQELLKNEKTKAEEREEHLLKVQRRSYILEDSLTSKIQQLTETLNSISCEKDQLLAESISRSSQHEEQISSINQEKDELQKLLQAVTSERDQLKTELQRNSERYVETNAKLESALEQLKQGSFNMSIQANSVDNAEKMFDNSLKQNLKIKELLEKFPSLCKRYECLSTVSLKLKNELESQKALVAVIMTRLSSEQSKQVKRLQYENEKRNGLLQSLLNKLKFLFSRVCSKKCNYYTTVNKHTTELLEEKRKQDQLQAQIQSLRKTYLNQNEISSQELNINEVHQKLQLDAESIHKDISEMANELLWIEAELQQEESARKETTQFWEACSGTLFDVEKIKEELKKDNERLLQVHELWTPKVKILLELSSELDARIASYCKKADVESKQTREKSEELFQQLNTLKEQLAPGASASRALEENYRLHNKLKAAEQDRKDMEVKIQSLENVINEVGKEVKEKHDRICELQAEMRIKPVTSELAQLQVKLDETKKSLNNALAENQSLQAQLDKGAVLYKEEIDHLKTKLVNYDMERTKQSKCFEIKLANYKAVVEQKEHQLRDLKEELRRARQEQETTVLQEIETPGQSQIPITCGGGSGIVQSTQMLVLKSEQAKLQKENSHLKKQCDLLLSNECQLKDELRKWKERALKWREKSLSESTREKVPKATMSSSFKEQIPSLSKEPVSQEIVNEDTSMSLPHPLTTNFFDNSGLNKLMGLQPVGTESPEEHVERWFRTPEKEKAPDCTTQ